MRLEVVCGAALAVAALLPFSAAAAEPTPAACPAIDVPASAGTTARLRAFVDPATGRLREPTADELRRLAEERLRARSEAAPRVFDVVLYPDGMQMVDLQDAFLFDLVLDKKPDGSTRMRCVPRSPRPAAAAER